jgi:PAS domain S-box-containing protein
MAEKPTYEELIKKVKYLEEERVGFNQKLENHQQSQDYFDKLVNYSNVPIIMWDFQTEITLFNPAFEFFTGYSSDEVMGKKLMMLFPQSSRNESMDKIANTIKGEEWESVNIPILHKNGKVLTFLWNSVNIHDDKTGHIVVTIAQGVDVTRRNIAENENRNNAENLKLIFNSTPTILMLVNDRARVEMLNDKGVIFCGKDKDEIIGLRGGDVFSCTNSFSGKGCGTTPDCSRCPVRSRIASTFETGKSFAEEEGQMTFKIDDEEISMDLLISTVRLELDGVKKVLLSLTDITSRKENEQFLKRQQDFLEKSQAMGKIGTWELDINKNRLLWTDENYRIFGITKGTELTYESFLSNVHPEDREFVNSKWNAALSGQPYDIEHRLIVDGVVKWVREKAELIFNEKNECVRAIGFSQDISDFRRVQDAKIESELKLRAILDNSPITMWCFDGERYSYISDEWYRSTGQDPALELTVERWSSMVHPDDIQSSGDIWMKNWNSKTAHVNYFRLQKSDGTYQSIRCDAFPIFNKDGEFQYFQGFNFDITKQLEAEVGRKTLEGQLHHSQKMESLGTLAGGIAHDFNNILFPIVGYTEMLLDDIPKDSPYRESLNEIYVSTLRAKELVKQILTFARQKSSELKLMKIQPIISEVLKLIRSTIPTTIDIKQDIDPACGVIKADPTQIHQIIMNLATNAYNAMEESGGELKISLKEVEFNEFNLINVEMTPGLYACLTVNDTGIGMENDLTSKIFDPFFTTKEVGKGTGMGLAIVHGVVKNMGGAIGLHSKLGEGTEFNIYLPVVKKSTKGKKTNNIEKLEKGTEHILLIDDEVAIIKMVEKMLERLGYKVTSKTNSINALECFRESPGSFDLVITDMEMPQMPGSKLSPELIKIRSDIPIILSTGYGDVMSKEKAASLGFQGFLLKPIEMKELSVKIREVLKPTST